MVKIKDFKSGPLDVYRNQASFDWKRLKVFLDGEEIVAYQNEVYEAIENHPDFSSDNSQSLDLEETRKAAYRQALAYKSMGFFEVENVLRDPRKQAANTRVTMSTYPATDVKFIVMYTLFSSSIVNMGSGRHSQFVEDNQDDKITGCYGLTEIAHGSNARGMRTTATFDKNRKVFVLNSPDFQAAKCWAGGMGQTATHGTIYAQLIVDGVRRGLHAFVVPLRNPKTLLPYQGVTIGDMGEKIGLNGVDNGFLIFDNYEIPRENLLNKTADVTEDGRYVTPLRDPSKRHGAALGPLSTGRMNISIICEAQGIKALTIAVRYSAVRRQFGPKEDEEVPILEYQSHQHRLIPYVAAAYVLRIFNNYFSTVFYESLLASISGQDSSVAAETGMEIHALSSACKPLASWTMRDAIQECRETCGGHGYLKVAGIGDIRNDFDANLTYEGENHVLIQQTSNWLLKIWPKVLQKQEVSSPLHSIDFLSLEILRNGKLNAHSVEDMIRPKTIIDSYRWLVTYLLKKTHDKLEKETSIGKAQFWAKNDTQVYFAKTLGIAYIQHFFLQRTLAFIQEATDASIRNVLLRLFSLYGLFSLEKHLPYLYEGGYATGPRLTTLVQDGVLKLCADLKNDAVSLIDSIAPPDFALRSVLGMSDGEVYKHLEQAMYTSPGTFSRPSWWREIVDQELKHKL